MNHATNKKPSFLGYVPLLAFLSCNALAGTVNIYTERQQVFLEPILQAFKETTGHEAKVLYLEKGAIARLRSEGRSSPADVVIVADIGRLLQLAMSDLVQPIVSAEVDRVVPGYLRDPGKLWLALTKRLRVVYVAKDAEVAPTSFEELADGNWRGKVCLRSGTHPYNIALFSSLLSHHGEDDFVTWLDGLKGNLARRPQGNDRAQIKGVANGECGVGVGNLYYYYKMLNSDDPAEREAAAKVRWVPVSVGDAGAHVNVSGIVLAANAPNGATALELIEFMVGKEAQGLYATANSELPVRSGVAMPAELELATAVKVDDIPLAEIAANRALVSELVTSAGFDG